MEITHKVRTSFKTVAPKKATKQSESNDKLLWEVMFYSYREWEVQGGGGGGTVKFDHHGWPTIKVLGF